MSNGVRNIIPTPTDIRLRYLSNPKASANKADPTEPDLLGYIMIWLSRIALANGFGKFVAAYNVNVTTTAVAIREHSGIDNRLLVIRNDDTVGAAILSISFESAVATGFPLRSTDDPFKILLTPGDKIYGKASAGTIPVKIMEFTEQPL